VTTSPTTPPQPATPARTLSDEAVDLATYRITDRVSERINKRLTFWLTVAGVVAGLVGFVGLSAFKTSVVHSMTDNVNKEVQPITDRARTEMVNNDISIAMIKKQNDEAQAKLDKVDEAVAKMDKLSADIKTLNNRLTAATEQTNNAINALRTAQEKLEAGRPSVFSTTFSLDKGGIIEGTNFGEGPGTVSIRVAFRHELTVSMAFFPPLGYTGWIPIDAQSITNWSNTRITLHFSDAF
jgi:hypothetical protein